MMEYKGYVGIVSYDGKAKVFHGDVINTRDVITFQGKTVDEIEKAFQESIDDYISWCEQDGVSSEKPYSGKFNKIKEILMPQISLYIDEPTLKKVENAAMRQKMSISKWVAEQIQFRVNPVYPGDYESLFGSIDDDIFTETIGCNVGPNDLFIASIVKFHEGILVTNPDRGLV